MEQQRGGRLQELRLFNGYTYDIFQAVTNTTFQAMKISYIEQLSIECRETKTKVITLANQSGHRQSSEPIKS